MRIVSTLLLALLFFSPYASAGDMELEKALTAPAAWSGKWQATRGGGTVKFVFSREDGTFKGRMWSTGGEVVANGLELSDLATENGKLSFHSQFGTTYLLEIKDGALQGEGLYQGQYPFSVGPLTAE